MPIHTGQDKEGQFYQWGKTGKKYYYDPKDKRSKQRALNKAKKQQTAIYSTGWKGDAMKLIRTIKKKDYFRYEQAKEYLEENISGEPHRLSYNVQRLTYDAIGFSKQEIETIIKSLQKIKKENQNFDKTIDDCINQLKAAAKKKIS